MNDNSFTFNRNGVSQITVSININYLPVCNTLDTDPVERYEPRVIRHTFTNDLFATNLYADMDESSEEDEDNLVRNMNALVFPEMDVVDDEDYQEHYTIPEDQLYDDEYFAMEVDGRPHPNVTLFRGNNPDVQCDDDDLSLMDLCEDDSHDISIAMEEPEDAYGM